MDIFALKSSPIAHVFGGSGVILKANFRVVFHNSKNPPKRPVLLNFIKQLLYKFPQRSVENFYQRISRSLPLAVLTFFGVVILSESDFGLVEG